MYDTSFHTTYNFYDISLANINPISKSFIDAKSIDFQKDYTEKELIESADYLYKNELMAAFGLTEFSSINNSEINNKIDELYNKLFFSIENSLDEKSKKVFQEMCKNLAESVLSEDEKIGFTMLFSYTYFHLTHLCLCDLFNKGAIQEENLTVLENCLKDYTKN
jgi:hypothetical protein